MDALEARQHEMAADPRQIGQNRAPKDDPQRRAHGSLLPSLVTSCTVLCRRADRHRGGKQDTGGRADRHMPGRADRLVGDDGDHRAGRRRRQPDRPLAKAHHQTEEIDRQQEVDPERMRIRNEIPEDGAEPALDDPGHVDRQPHAHIPGKSDLFAGSALRSASAYCGSVSRKKPAACCAMRPMPDAAADGSRNRARGGS